MPDIRASYNTYIPQTCGVGVSGVFRVGNGMYPLETMENCGGAGWHIASFTNEEVHKATYKKAYAELRKRWKMVYQSPVRVNKRTNNKFFFVLYDTRSTLGPVSKKAHNDQFGDYPLEI